MVLATKQPKRFLLLGCSQAKHREPEFIPALERYDGTFFRVLKRYLRHDQAMRDELEISILSAEFGLLKAAEEIPYYDRLMSARRAAELRPQIEDALKQLLSGANYCSVLFCFGKNYSLACGDLSAICESNAVFQTTGAIGFQARQLKSWLYENSLISTVSLDNKLSVAENSRSVPITFDDTQPKTATLQGRKVCLSKCEVEARARVALERKNGQPENYRDWFVLIDNRRVGVKWLAAELTGVPVGNFTSGQARRFLRQFQIESNKVEK